MKSDLEVLNIFLIGDYLESKEHEWQDLNPSYTQVFQSDYSY